MDQQTYQTYVEQVTPKVNGWISFLKAFVTGGIICVLGQGLYEWFKFQGCMHNLANNYTTLVLISLSVVAKENGYTRPQFSRYNEYLIKEGRHPVIEAVLEKEFIPNDLTLYNDEKVLVITGPNMSGKSTFMRQNAIISIMAQMGSYVPCKSATLPIFDQIFTASIAFFD